MPKTLDISVIVPAYNEEESITELNEWISRVMKTHGFSYEILLIDDGSTDKTPQILQELTTSHEWIRSVRLDETPRDLGIHVAHVYTNKPNSEIASQCCPTEAYTSWPRQK